VIYEIRHPMGLRHPVPGFLMFVTYLWPLVTKSDETTTTLREFNPHKYGMTLSQIVNTEKNTLPLNNTLTNIRHHK